MRTQLYFIDSIVQSVHMIGGRITVVAIPNEKTGAEDIASVGFWIPHSKLREFDKVSVMVRSKQYRAIFGTWNDFGGWGWTLLSVYTFYKTVYELLVT